MLSPRDMALAVLLAEALDLLVLSIDVTDGSCARLLTAPCLFPRLLRNPRGAVVALEAGKQVLRAAILTNPAVVHRRKGSSVRRCVAPSIAVLACCTN